MNKVITINLNGNAYQLEESGYDKLHGYLDQAAAKLADNPDKTEIMADFEQAIADKFGTYLDDHKTVVTAVEVGKVLDEMGPVEAGKTEENEHKSTSESPRRLYRIREGQWVAGICTGLAAYFNLDVTLIRTLFAIFTLVTSGFGILVYIIMMILIPEARLPEERAAAHGQTFNAHDFLEETRTKYAYLGDKKYWHKKKEEIKRNFKQAAGPQRGGREIPYVNSGWYAFLRFCAGLIAALLMTIVVIGTIVWIGALWSIFGHGTIFNYFGDLDRWLQVTLVTICYGLVIIPLQGLASDCIRYVRRESSRQLVWLKITQGFVWVVLLAWLTWIVGAYPVVRNDFHAMKSDLDQRYHLSEHARYYFDTRKQ